MCRPLIRGLFFASMNKKKSPESRALLCLFAELRLMMRNAFQAHARFHIFFIKVSGLQIMFPEYQARAFPASKQSLCLTNKVVFLRVNIFYIYCYCHINFPFWKHRAASIPLFYFFHLMQEGGEVCILFIQKFRERKKGPAGANPL
mgnify:CR=1 FL=1